MSLKVPGWDTMVRNRKRKFVYDAWALDPTLRRGYKPYFKKRSSGPYNTLSSSGSQHCDPVYPKPEVKYLDKAQTGVAFTGTPVASPITSNGTVIMLGSIQPGATSAQRIGQQVTIRSCTYRYELDLPVIPGNQVATSGRVMLVWDRQPNGVLAAYTDIFVGQSFLAYMLPGASQRFVILRNDQYSLSPNGTQVVFEEGHISINMLSTFGTASNLPISGALLLVFISDQNVAANQPTIAGAFRIRYMDN